MYQEQRLEKILELLEERKQLSVKKWSTTSRSQKIPSVVTSLSLINASWFARTHGGLLPQTKNLALLI